jgi:glycosyltransferase involved in cell wall biosynthesis
MKIALVHDYLNQFGGAERVVMALHEIFPNAPIYTSIYDPKRLPKNFEDYDVRFSFMQYLPWVSAAYRYYFLIYPWAFQSFDLAEYEVILSSSSAYAKGIRKNPEQLHICYCHTPARFLWRLEDYLKQEPIPSWIKTVLPYFLGPLKKWDVQNTQGVDFFIANSAVVAQRIKKIYGRESVIINPPVDGEFFKPSSVDRDYFLVVSRLNAYKRIDLVVEVFNQLELPLKIIGTGPAFNNLKKMAREHIEFLGKVSDLELARYLAECRALIFPGEEDFGIVPLEAMACGRPVIAYRKGGVLETMLDEETGVFFYPQTSEALSAAVKRFQFMVFDKHKIREHALKFDKKVFKRKIEEFVNEKYQEKFHES